MTFPTGALILLGFGAVAGEYYRIYKFGEIRKLGSLLVTIYITAAYVIVHAIDGFTLDETILLRIGMGMLLLDKILVFASSLLRCDVEKSIVNFLSLRGGKYGR